MLEPLFLVGRICRSLRDGTARSRRLTPEWRHSFTVMPLCCLSFRTLVTQTFTCIKSESNNHVETDLIDIYNLNESAWLARPFTLHVDGFICISRLACLSLTSGQIKDVADGS